MRLVELITILDEPEHMDGWSEVWCWAVRELTGNGSRMASLFMNGAVNLKELADMRGGREGM